MISRLIRTSRSWFEYVYGHITLEVCLPEKKEFESKLWHSDWQKEFLYKSFSTLHLHITSQWNAYLYSAKQPHVLITNITVIICTAASSTDRLIDRSINQSIRKWGHAPVQDVNTGNWPLGSYCSFLIDQMAEIVAVQFGKTTYLFRNGQDQAKSKG